MERLDALPRRRALGLAGDVPVPVSLEAGRMRLSVNELSSLEPDDVLLPETYPAREGRVTLRLCATSRSLAFACSLAEGCATILSVLNPEEGPMSDENNTAAGAAPSEGVDTGELEVTLTFELERRLMTVRDVETLAPGYTFAFGGTSATAGCKASKRRLPSSTRHVRSPQTTSKAHTGGTGAARPLASNAHGVPATSMGHGCARVHSRLKTCASSGESAGARKGSISMYSSAPGNGGLLQKVSGCASSNGWRGTPPRASGSDIPFVRSDILAARLPTPIAALRFGPTPFRNHFDANILLKRPKPRLQLSLIHISEPTRP